VGVIETLSSGFDRVTKRPWLVIVPILLNMATWIGPKLSISRLTGQLLLALPSMAELDVRYQQSLELAREWLVDIGTSVNVLSILSMGALGLPSLPSSVAPPIRLFWPAQGAIEIPSWPWLLGLTAALALLSLLIGSFCLSLIAQEARDEQLDVAYVVGSTWRAWRRLVALAMMILVLVAVAAMGISILSGLVMLLSSELASLMLNVSAMVGLWLSVYVGIIFFFTPRSMVLDDMGIAHALWSSFNVVRHHLFPSIGFILLVNIIQTGLTYIWHALAGSVAGTVLAIAGNAYVGVGLVMASFVFYRDRFADWQEAKGQSSADKEQA
jgi:hypothetical protein